MLSRASRWREVGRAAVVVGAAAALALPAFGSGAAAHAAVSAPFDARNVLVNGGFEQRGSGGAQPAGWAPDVWSSSAVLSWDGSVAHQGRHSVRVQADLPNDARWTQTVAVEPNTVYRLTGWIKTSDVHSVAGQSVNAGASLGFLGLWDRSVGVLGTEGWTQVGMTLNSGDQTQLTVAARLGFWSGLATGTAWFDDVRLTAVTSPQRIVNAGFESGAHAAGAIPAGWGQLAAVGSSSSFGWDCAVSHSGKRSVRITSAIADDAMWTQAVPVRPHTRYELSGWIKTAGVNHSADLLDPGANLSFLGTWDRSAPVFGTQGWTRVSVTTDSGDQTYLVVAARLGYWSGITTGTAWFDDLTLTALS